MDDKYILIICSEFAKDTNACSVCIRNVVKEINLQGYKVLVISLVVEKGLVIYDSNYKVFEIKRSLFSRLKMKCYSSHTFLSSLIYKLAYILRLPSVLLFYPNYSKRVHRDIVKVASDIIEYYAPQTVIATYTPVETIKANLTLKKKFADRKIRFINYHLDPLLIPDNKLQAINKFKYKKAIKFALEELSIIDKGVYPVSEDGIIKSDKAEYVEFPLFIVNSDSKSTFQFPKSTINLSYVGTLDTDNRNAHYLFELIDIINRFSDKVRLHIWGLILDNEMMTTINQYSFIEYHGFIDSSEVPYILSHSDININISNKLSYNAIPSKIFQLFAAGRPIINIVRNSNDYSLRYFYQYKNFLRINDYEPKSCDHEVLEKYIINVFKDKTTVDTDTFNKCTPEYIAKSLVYF